jgi:hypothetical protein
MFFSLLTLPLGLTSSFSSATNTHDARITSTTYPKIPLVLGIVAFLELRLIVGGVLSEVAIQPDMLIGLRGVSTIAGW